MRKIFSLILVVMVLLPLVQVQAQPVAPDAGVPIDSLAPLDDASPTDQIIIKYKASADLAGAYAPAQADRMSQLSAAAGVPLTYFREMSGDAHVLRLSGKLPVSQVSQISARLMQLADVEYAEPDYIMQHTLTPNDTRYGEQWHYFDTWGINAPAAWDITTGSSNVVAAVIDTGITSHSDLAGRTVAGYDFISDTTMANDGGGRDSDPSDPGDWVAANECYSGSSARNSSWHGTHVAGTIGAKTNNSAGVAGINWVSKILPVRVLGKCGGMSSDIADGMRWAAGLAVSGVTPNANPAKVLNLSLGGGGACGTTYQAAVDAVTAAGATVIVAAGNDNADASSYQPASCNGVITVAATNRNGYRSYYSNYGSVVEISAPGGETTVSSNGVLSTLNSGTTAPSTESYAFYQGTSMATPHVVGVASLMLSVNPSLTPAQVNNILRSTARAFPVGGTCTTSNCGAGIVDAAAAVRAVAYDVGITKQVIGSNLKPGDRITFTLSIANTGGVTATNVVVTDIVPSQVLTRSYANSLPITPTGVVSYVWNVGTLGVGKTGVITIYGRIDPALPSDFSFTNSASISAGQDGTSSNNRSSVTIGGSKVYLPIVMKQPPPPSGPTPGFWQDTVKGTEFTVPADRAHVNSFAIYVSLTGCGNYKITHNVSEPINGNSFSFSGSYYASGTFNSATAASGTTGLASFGPICGYYWTGGPWSWSATWQSAQVAFMPAHIVEPNAAEPVASGGDFYIVTPIK